MKKLYAAMIAFLLCIMVAGCGSTPATNAISETETEDGRITIGFSQLGAESDWRSMNTESMKTTFSTTRGYNLIIEDGQQKQANQITAIRNFIQQGVDYIVLAPVTENGWETVLGEAQDAGIPVIIVDRMVAVEDDSLFSCWVGSDFELEGQKAAEWLHQYSILNEIAPEALHIVNIQGTLGASAQLGRTKALEDAVAEFGWDLLEEAPGDFTQAKGEEVMAELLDKYSQLNVVYCENDNEALGAIEAIEDAGRVVGSDIANGEIMVLSFDGVNHSAVQYAVEGKISCITECNPMHGPRVEAIIEALEAGQTPEKFEYVDEAIYSSFDQITELTIQNQSYPVTILTPDMPEL